MRLTEADALASVDRLFGPRGTAGSSSNTNTLGATVERTYVTQRGCNMGLSVHSARYRNGKSVDISTTLDTAARMAHTVRTSTHPGVRQIALLKHYRFGTIRLMSSRELKLGLSNSFLFPSLSHEIQVPESAFSAVHELGNIAARLELDCLHAAVTSHREEVADVINRFRVKQPTLITDEIARASISKELHFAVKWVASMIDRSNLYKRMQDEIKTQPKEEVKSYRPRSHWEFGINPQGPIVSNTKYRSVTIPGGQRAYQCFLVAKIQSKYAPVKLHFIANGSHYPRRDDPENEFTYIGDATIIGWTLSCDNADGEEARFKFAGGIGKKDLGITAVASCGSEWHCRVTFL